MTRELDAGGALLDYYRRRAQEYERIYERPERQADLATLTARLRALLCGQRVLELACGTGYWTERVAPVAAWVLATDLAPEPLAVAQGKAYPSRRVEFRTADAYATDAIPGDFNALMAGFWWSHVPRERRTDLLAAVHLRMGPGARVVLFDNRYVAGSSTPIHRTDAAGNTYQWRALADGSRHEVLKNFPTAADLRAAVSGETSWIEVAELTYYWCLSYRIGVGDSFRNEYEG